MKHFDEEWEDDKRQFPEDHDRIKCDIHGGYVHIRRINTIGENKICDYCLNDNKIIDANENKEVHVL